MNLFDVYPLFNIGSYKARDVMYGIARETSTSTYMAAMP